MQPRYRPEPALEPPDHVSARPALIALAAFLLVPASAFGATLGGWDRGAQRTAARAGLLAAAPGRGFDGAAPLSLADERAALVALAGRLGTRPVAVAAPPTVAGFDAALVSQLGLADVAAHVQGVARAAGLAPPARFGTEVVARYLGLRFNHPAGDDRLELFPADPVTRAEAAWSLARVLALGRWETDGVRRTLGAFALPAYGAAQREALSIAVSRIGFPYVWGGESDGRSDPMTGAQIHGGYDCSGFVWRVFKLSGLAAGDAIRGRTAAQMAGEIGRGARVPLARVRAGDVLFFGSAGLRGHASERSIVHTGIALSPDWVIHSSGQGVYVLPLRDSWLGSEFAWARRVL